MRDTNQRNQERPVIGTQDVDDLGLDVKSQRDETRRQHKQQRRRNNDLRGLGVVLPREINKSRHDGRGPANRVRYQQSGPWLLSRNPGATTTIY